jgi:hypothetical protein
MRTLVEDAVGWGLALWAFGYLLGILLFFVVPSRAIGWVILPIGAALTTWVAFRRVHATGLRANAIVALTWTAIAILGDYLFIVRAFAPPDGYYRTDVYVYYALAFVIPLMRVFVGGPVDRQRLANSGDTRRLVS